MEISQARWLMFEQGTSMVSKPLVVVVVFWLVFIFLSWGLFAPFNGTVVATFLIAAVSVSAAILLVEEMYMPYAGILRISSDPLGQLWPSLDTKPRFGPSLPQLASEPGIYAEPARTGTDQPDKEEYVQNFRKVKKVVQPIERRIDFGQRGQIRSQDGGQHIEQESKARQSG